MPAAAPPANTPSTIPPAPPAASSRSLVPSSALSSRSPAALPRLVLRRRLGADHLAGDAHAQLDGVGPALARGGIDLELDEVAAVGRVAEVALLDVGLGDRGQDVTRVRLGVGVGELQALGLDLGLEDRRDPGLAVGQRRGHAEGLSAPTLNEYHAGESTLTSVVYWPAP